MTGLSPVFDQLYERLRGAVGFSLLVAGASLLLAQARPGPAIRAFARLFMLVGLLFIWSSLDPFLRLPVDLDSFLFLLVIYLMGWNVLDIAMHVFGGERLHGIKRRIDRGGAAYMAALFLVGLLDYPMGWRSITTGVEDGLARGPLHQFAMSASYLWLIAAIALGIFFARWNAVDLPAGRGGSRRLLLALSGLVATLALAALSLVLHWRIPYRIAHFLIELQLLSWYLFLIRFPGFFSQVRAEVAKEHKRRFELGRDEVAEIKARLATVAADPSFYCDEGLNLASLARRVGVPAYRLSRFFGTELGNSFPAWLNGLRIGFVKRLMVERPDLSILELSVEAGYKSSSTFFEQFTRLAGMSPSEYRKTISGQ